MKNIILLVCLTISILAYSQVQAQNTFTDPKTQISKNCHFSCAKCTDSSDLCVKCSISMNFFIKENNKFKCFALCPRGYQPATDDHTTISAVECIPDAMQESRNQHALNQKFNNMCGLSQYWNGTQCQNCSSNCISCSNVSNCEECMNGFFWNNATSKCQQCHFSCSSCKDPKYTDCLTCSSLSTFYPDTNGVCDQSAPKIDFVINYKKKQDIFANLKDCSLLLINKPTSYIVQYKKLYVQNDPKWATTLLINQNQISIPTFSQKYPALANQIQNCSFNQISKPVMSSKGSLITSYAMILSQHGAQLNQAIVNPQSLSAFIKEQQLQSILYMKKARKDFSCDQLSCESQLNSYIPFIPTSNKTKVSLKVSKEITLSRKGKNVDCFDESQSSHPIDDSKIDEIEIAFAQAAFSQKSSTKLYAIADVCGTTTHHVSRVQFHSMLISNYFVNGFFNALRTDLSGKEQLQNLYLQGADKTQNSNLKKCKAGFSNQYDSFSITKIRFIEVQEVADTFEKEANRYSQYSAKVNSQIASASPVAKCFGIELGNLVISNDNPNNYLSNQVNAANKILTSSIDLDHIKGYLNTLSIDERSLKAQKIVLSEKQAQQIFNLYLKDQTAQATTCYTNLSEAAQNIQSVLVDFYISNNQQCILSKDIISSIEANDVNALITSIQANSWCTTQQTRCQKSLHILKGCL